MKRTKIEQLMAFEVPAERILVKGWVRTKRDSKTFSFLEINDGSCLANLQVVADEKLPNYEEIRKLTTGASVAVEGAVVPSQGSGQQWELQAAVVTLVGAAPESFPLQKKRHSDEFLRGIAHLRARTNKYSAAFRIRSELALAVHRFFHERGFRYIHTPILTASDCEGAGELFRVTTLPPGERLLENDFFGVESNLTVSGQLEAEMLATALGDVYTFGPTFRAENSNTRRHAAEFWMIEPEMAFCDLQEDMDLAEEMIKYLANHVIDHCADDLNLFARFVDKNLMAQLGVLTGSAFERIPYAEAIRILEKSGASFEYPVAYGTDMQSEHERFLTEHHFKKPVMVYDFPKTIKPFYMRMNDDGQTVASMDVLVAGIGEIIGGSQREERYDMLATRMDQMGLSKEKYWWYLESRLYGSVPHSGFGLGFERLVMMVTGISNIRDVIPFPRTPKNIEF
ncbi:MAG: asparaginyl-tRNA synthetase [Desulfatitalea sp. BRH_c12]|nr:MAG: asparaginyl-tRNA synthetase [Desulfatitalea sp. BRH_c12]